MSKDCDFFLCDIDFSPIGQSGLILKNYLVSVILQKYKLVLE